MSTLEALHPLQIIVNVDREFYGALVILLSGNLTQLWPISNSFLQDPCFKSNTQEMRMKQMITKGVMSDVLTNFFNLHQACWF